MRIYRIATRPDILISEFNIPADIAEMVSQKLAGLEKDKGKLMSFISKHRKKMKKNPNLPPLTWEEIDNYEVRKGKVSKLDKQINKVTENVRFREWVKEMVNNGSVQLEDLYTTVKKLLEDFQSLIDRNIIPENQRDINQYATDSDLFNLVKKYRQEESTASLEEILSKHPEAYTKLFDGPSEGEHVIVLEVNKDGKDFLAEIGKDTSWCVSHGAFDNYTPPFHLFLINGEPEVLININSRQIKDISDHPLEESSIIKTIDPIIDKLGLKFEAGDFSVYQKTKNLIEKMTTGDDELIRKMIDRNISYIFLLENEKFFKYLPAYEDKLVKYFDQYRFESIDKTSKKNLERLGSYYEVEGLPRFKEKVEHAIITWLSHNEERYLKKVPRVFRSPGLKDVPRINSICSSASKTPEEIDQQLKEVESGPNGIQSVSKAIKFSFATEDIWKLEKTFNNLPDRWKNNTEILSYFKDTWIEIALRAGMGDVDSPRISPPKILMGDQDFLRAYKQGWINELTTRPISWKAIPDDLKNDEDIKGATRSGYEKELSKSYKIWNDMPEDLKRDPKMHEFLFKGAFNYIKNENMKHSKFEEERIEDFVKNDMKANVNNGSFPEVLHEFIDGPDFENAFVAKFIRAVEKNPININMVPDKYMVKDVIVASVDAWINTFLSANSADNALSNYSSFLKYTSGEKFQDLKQEKDAEIKKALKKSFEIYFAKHPYHYNGHIISNMPEFLQEDKDIRASARQSCISLAREKADWIALVPKEFINDKEIMGAFQEGMVNDLSLNKVQSYLDLPLEWDNESIQKAYIEALGRLFSTSVGIFQRHQVPDRIKGSPYYLDKMTDVSLEILKERGPSYYDNIPNEIRKCEKFKRLIPDYWLEYLKGAKSLYVKNPTRFDSILEEEIFEFPQIQDFVIECWIEFLEAYDATQSVRQVSALKRCPKFVLKNDRARELMVGAYVQIVKDNPPQIKRIPEEYKNHPLVQEAYRDIGAWAEYVKLSGLREEIRDLIPEEFMGRPEIKEANIDYHLYRFNKKLDFKEPIPEYVIQSPRFIQGIVELTAKDDGLSWAKLPEEIMHSPQLAEVGRKKFVERLNGVEVTLLGQRDVPESVRRYPEIMEAWKLNLIKYLDQGYLCNDSHGWQVLLDITPSEIHNDPRITKYQPASFAPAEQPTQQPTQAGSWLKKYIMGRK